MAEKKSRVRINIPEKKETPATPTSRVRINGPSQPVSRVKKNIPGAK